MLVLQVLGYVAAQDSVSQPFDDGCLSGARFADEDGVVLRASRQDLQHTSYLIVASDDGVQLAGPCLVHEIACIFLQTLVGIFARLRLHLLAAAQFLDGFLQLLLVHAHVLEHLGGCAVHGQYGLQDVFQRDELVAVFLGEILSLYQYFVCFATQVWFAARHLG